MSPGSALSAALGGFYHQSWRFFLLNAALSAVVVPLAVAGLWVPLAWVLLPAAGPFAAALMHCAVVDKLTGELRLRDAVTGLRLHWRRGLLLGAVLAIGALAAYQSISFYASRGVLVLAVVGAYLAAMFAVYQVVLWPLAVFEFQRPFRQVAADAVRALLRRPVQTFVLAVALLAINLAGLAAAAMPFLTLTIAYSFLAAAYFALPPSTLEGDDRWPR